MPNLHDDVALKKSGTVEDLESDESVFTIYTLFLFVILWLLETLFSRYVLIILSFKNFWIKKNKQYVFMPQDLIIFFLFRRLFYTSHLVQIICHILESLSDVREFRQVGQGLIFVGTIHHSHHKTHLWLIFTLHKVLR